MKTNFFILITIGLFITSCGMQSKFGKKHHQHHKYIKVGEKTSPDKLEEKEPLRIVSANKDKEVSDRINSSVTSHEVEKTFSKKEETVKSTSGKTQKISPVKEPAKSETTKKTETTIPVETFVLENNSRDGSVESLSNDGTKSIEEAKLTNNKLLLVILAILIPPLAVGLYEGITTRFWISLLLTLLFYIPGMIYSLIVVLE